MPELRKDPIIGRWVIISTERGMRPSDFTMMEEKKKGGFCPFCPGNEGATPPEILSYRENTTKPKTPGWSHRVVANKYPAQGVKIERRKILNNHRWDSCSFDGGIVVFLFQIGK